MGKRAAIADTGETQKERPIIFSGPMVRAVLDGRKNQTRRIIKTPTGLNQPRFYPGRGWRFTRIKDNGAWPGPSQRMAINWLRCPYGSVGDRLWVRETHWRHGYWSHPLTPPVHFISTAGQPAYFPGDGRLENYSAPKDRTTRAWYKRPSIHMPRWASRITLEITKVRVERLQEISEEDAQAEGVVQTYPSYITSYAALWDSINGKGAWDKNPWVFVIEFKRDDVDRRDSSGVLPAATANQDSGSKTPTAL